MKIIGITGPARAGKDTVADIINDNDEQAIKVSFADPIKVMLSVGFSLSEDQIRGDLKETIDPRYGKSPRHMMQTLGTEWGRKLIHPDIWVLAIEAYINRFSEQSFGPLKFIIPDVRFDNEAEFVRQHGRLIHIRGRNVDIGDASEHASEAGVGYHPKDIIIDNRGDLNALHDQVYAAMELCNDG